MFSKRSLLAVWGVLAYVGYQSGWMRICHHPSEWTLGAWPFPLWLAILIWTLLTIYSLVKSPPPQAGMCRTCGYNLTGNSSGICPECGQPVDNGLRKQSPLGQE